MIISGPLLEITSAAISRALLNLTKPFFVKLFSIPIFASNAILLVKTSLVIRVNEPCFGMTWKLEIKDEKLRKTRAQEACQQSCFNDRERNKSRHGFLCYIELEWTVTVAFPEGACRFFRHSVFMKEQSCFVSLLCRCCKNLDCCLYKHAKDLSCFICFLLLVTWKRC